MKFHYVIVLIKLYVGGGNDFSIILCTSDNLLREGF